MTTQQRDDAKRVAQLGMVLIGAAILTGTIMGALYGAAREAVGSFTVYCLDDC